MSKQIAVRLPDDIVEYIDRLVGQGRAGSREAATRDAAILARAGADPDLDDLAEYAVSTPPSPARFVAGRRRCRSGRANGLDHDRVVSCRDVVAVPKTALGQQIGYLLPAQEAPLAAAIRATSDLV
jgi:mRNA-degrading endonuclease toxin of MazEF toxin-antitoxin module